MKKFLKINLLKAEHYADAVFIVLKGKHFKELALLSHRKKVQVSHPVVGRGRRCHAGKADAPAQHPQSCPSLWLWLLQPIVSVQQPRVGKVVNKDAAKHEHATGSGVVIRISISFHHDFFILVQ